MINSEAANDLLTSLPPPAEWMDGRWSEVALSERLDGQPMAERWKYTNARRLLAAAPADQPVKAPTAPFRTLDTLPVNDRRLLIEQLTGVDVERYPLAAIIQRRTATAGCRVQGKAELVLDAHQGGFDAIAVHVDADSELDLIDARPASAFSMRALSIHVAENAKLRYHGLHAPAQGVDWQLTSVTLAAGAQLRATNYARGAHLRRLDLHVRLCGEDAHLELDSATAVTGQEHLDQQTVIEHVHPAATSRQRVHGIAAERGKSTFNGRIHIHPHASRSDASLSCRYLALTDGAEINAKPELEIYNDDVRCAHGATIGALSDDELFYLRSRGIDGATAASLLTRAFLASRIQGPLAERAFELLTGAIS